MKSYVLGLTLALVSAGPAWSQTGAGDGPWLIPPVDAAISRHFEPPESDYGAGHRGVDYVVLPGTAVRAAGAGTVTFAGHVGGAYALTLAHGFGIETTYSMLAAINVEEGQAVGRGTWIGRSGSSHPDSDGGLHFAVKVHDRYVDPLDYLGALDVTEAIHLAPIPDLRTVSGSLQAAFEAVGVGFEPCTNSQRAEPIPASPPNGNVVVAIAGISSKTKGGSNSKIFEVPEALGYPPDRIYHFSYRGLSGPRWHEPYEYADTNTDLVHQAERLALLLQIVAHEHPGADVDVVAHSQGGIIARTYLEGMADSWTADTPRVEHLVTFATPHSGSAVAHLADDLRAESLTGGLLAKGASFWADHGGPIPDPDSAAAQQLKTDSELVKWLASEDVAYGTRVLALAVPDDLVATADSAVMPGELSRVVPPQGMTVEDAPDHSPKRQVVFEGIELAGKLLRPGLGALEVALDVGPDVVRAARAHSSILESDYTRRIAYTFLGDHPDPCSTGWDAWGRSSGALIAGAERTLGGVYGAAEALTATRLGAGRVYWGARAAQDLLRELRKDRAPSVGGYGR